jgi:hypothetical protein
MQQYEDKKIKVVNTFSPERFEEEYLDHQNNKKPKGKKMKKFRRPLK